MDAEDRAFLQGQVLQGLADLTGSVAEMREDFRLFKQEAYGIINKNSQSIARAKGVLVSLAIVGGIIGSFLKTWIKYLR